MEVNGIAKSLQKKKILITGSTGFLAKSTALNFLLLLHVCVHVCLRPRVLLTSKMSGKCSSKDPLFSLIAVFVEKVLRAQPDVSKLFLLVRAEDDRSAQLRLHDEVNNKICVYFFFLSEMHMLP